MSDDTVINSTRRVLYTPGGDCFALLQAYAS